MKRVYFVLISAGIFLLSLSGCNLPNRSPAEPLITPTEEIIDTPEPTETPTPLPEREKIVFIPSDEVPDVTDGLTRALESLCTEAFDCVTASSEDEAGDDADFIIFAKEPTAVSSLTERFPRSQIILAAAPKTNLPGVWVIQYDEAFFPFLAGLATTSNANDWRSAGLIPNDSLTWGTRAEEAYLNGAHYFCGNCRSSLAPYVSFPLVISLPSNTAPENWSTQFDEAQKSFIYTVFLADEAVSEPLLQKLAGLNVLMLGVSEPPAGFENNWLAAIRFDWTETLRQIMQRSDAGEKQGSTAPILSITPGTLSESFSEGKANLLRRAYSDLLSGLLSPYTPTEEYAGQ